MSIFGTMKTAVSGMSAQANRLGTVGDNIANVNTTAYKKVTTAFSSFVLPSTPGAYNSGGVQTSVTNSISQQGAPVATNSTTDLAISGDGFFFVEDPSGRKYYTRNGSFSIQQVTDTITGKTSSTMVNSAGYILLAAADKASVGDPGQYERITVEADKLTKVASSSASITANFDSNASTVSGGPGNTFTTTATFYEQNYGNQGLFTIDFTKTAANQWQAQIRTNIPLTAPGYTPPIAAGGVVSTLTITLAGNKVSSITDGATAVTGTVFNVKGIDFDFTRVTEVAEESFAKIAANGSAPAALDSVTVDKDGTVFAIYANGSKKALGIVGLATFASPDQLSLGTGNVYSPTTGSGNPIFGAPQQAGVGTIIAGALESSNVDLANELTEMIEAQRSYTANSKVFQTGADILDVLVNLKR